MPQKNLPNIIDSEVLGLSSGPAHSSLDHFDGLSDVSGLGP